MIEVVFDESTKGAMKVAKGPGKARFEGDVLEGSPSDVLCIALALDMGDIGCEVESEMREALLAKMFLDASNASDVDREEIKKYWNKSVKELERLRMFARNGEVIRIWYNEAPYAMCGFYCINSLLKDYPCEVRAVKLPQYSISEGDPLRIYSNWAEVEPEKFPIFLSDEKEINQAQRQYLSLEWERLRGENAPLRAVVNGRLSSVSIIFYDDFIRKEIPEGPFVMARLIGDILGKYHLGVGDWWYAQRIHWMIGVGELEIIEESDFAYGKVLQRVQY